MKTYIEIEIDKLGDNAYHYRISESMKPTVGHFGPSVLVCTGTEQSLDNALANIIKDMCNQPTLVNWATTKLNGD